MTTRKDTINKVANVKPLIFSSGDNRDALNFFDFCVDL